MRHEYALLLSSASATVNPNMVHATYPTRAEAGAAGLTIVQAQPGLEYAVMGRNLVGEWREKGTGRTISQCITERWS